MIGTAAVEVGPREWSGTADAQVGSREWSGPATEAGPREWRGTAEAEIYDTGSGVSGTAEEVVEWISRSRDAIQRLE